jgi:hypothetical protein
MITFQNLMHSIEANFKWFEDSYAQAKKAMGVRPNLPAATNAARNASLAINSLFNLEVYAHALYGSLPTDIVQRITARHQELLNLLNEIEACYRIVNEGNLRDSLRKVSGSKSKVN